MCSAGTRLCTESAASERGKLGSPCTPHIDDFAASTRADVAAAIFPLYRFCRLRILRMVDARLDWDGVTARWPQRPLPET